MQDIRKLTVTGNKTYYVTIPRWMAEKLKWRKGQRVEIKMEKNNIKIVDWEEK